MLEKAGQEGFMKRPYQTSIAISHDPAEMLDLLLGDGA